MTPRKRIPSAETRKDWSLSVALLAVLAVLLLFSMRKLHLAQMFNGASSAEVADGLTALKAKNIDEAKRKFDALIAKSPQDPMPYLQILQACQNLRRWDVAADYARRGLKEFAGDDKKEMRSFLYSNLANSLSELKGANWKKEALSAAEEAYRLTPNDANSQNVYGYMLADLSEDPASIEKALQILRGAVEMAEGRVRDADAALFLSAVLDSYGWALCKKGDAGGAIVTLQRAINVIPAEAINTQSEAQPGQMSGQELKVYYYHLGAAHYKAKQMTEARRALETALKYDPQYEEARKIVSALPASTNR